MPEQRRFSTTMEFGLFRSTAVSMTPLLTWMFIIINLVVSTFPSLGIVLQCRLLPASSCRMRIMKLFRDMRARFDDREVSDLTVVIRTKIARQEVMQLLQHDLVPAIRFDVIVGVIIDSNVGFRYYRQYARLGQVDE